MESRYFAYPNEPQGAATPAAMVELGLLAGADEADWSLLFDYGERRMVAAGEVVIERGSVGRSLIIVLVGSFRVMAPSTRRGRHAVVRTLGEGDVVGEVGFAVGGPRSHTVIAGEAGEIFEFEWEAFERLAAAHPALGIRFLSDVLHIVAARTRANER